MSESRAARSALFTPRPRAWRRTLGAVGAALAVAAAASACSSGNGGIEKSGLNVGVVDGIGAATFELGVQQHYFDQNGLSITVSHFDTDAQAESALQKGTVDIAFGDYSSFLYAGHENPVGGKVQVIGEGYDAGENTIGLITKAGSNLLGQTVSGATGVSGDIAGGGLSVDVPASDSPEFLALANWAILEQTPLNQTSQRVHTIGASSDGATTAQTEIANVEQGSVDTAVLQEPYLTQALETGKVAEIANLDSGNAANMPVAGYFMLSSTAKSDPNTIAAFQAGLSQAQSLGASRVQVEAALTAAKLSPQVAATASIGNYPTAIVQASLANVLSLMGSANLDIGTQDATMLTGGATLA
jgi:NitT/TauT family transport system substrate-binding protein